MTQTCSRLVLAWLSHLRFVCCLFLGLQNCPWDPLSSHACKAGKNPGKKNVACSLRTKPLHMLHMLCKYYLLHPTNELNVFDLIRLVPGNAFHSSRRSSLFARAAAVSNQRHFSLCTRSRDNRRTEAERRQLKKSHYPSLQKPITFILRTSKCSENN